MGLRTSYIPRELSPDLL